MVNEYSADRTKQIYIRHILTATQCTTHPSATRGARCDTFCPATHSENVVRIFTASHFSFFFDLVIHILKTVESQILRSVQLRVGLIVIRPLQGSPISIIDRDSHVRSRLIYHREII